METRKMRKLKWAQILLILSKTPFNFGQVTEDSSRCKCSACKVVPSGQSAGTYELVEGQEKMCQNGCLYQRMEDGLFFCMCEPGNVPFSQGFQCSGKSIASFSLPTISFQRRWKTKLEVWKTGMDHTSVSLAVQNGTIFVLNGDVKMVGNYIEQFDMAGNSLGEWPGWYHWPQDMVAHSKNILMPS